LRGCRYGITVLSQFIEIFVKLNLLDPQNFDPQMLNSRYRSPREDLIGHIADNTTILRYSSPQISSGRCLPKRPAGCAA
jgi:hypothetical protein